MYAPLCVSGPVNTPSCVWKFCMRYIDLLSQSVIYSQHAVSLILPELDCCSSPLAGLPPTQILGLLPTERRCRGRSNSPTLSESCTGCLCMTEFSISCRLISVIVPFAKTDCSISLSSFCHTLHLDLSDWHASCFLTFLDPSTEL